METYVHKQDNSNYLYDNMLQQVGCVWQSNGNSSLHLPSLYKGLVEWN